VSADRDPEGVSTAYDRWAATYDSDANRTRDLDALVVRRAAPDVTARDVLELAPGTGKNTVWLAERARSVIGLDASPGMLAVARRRVTAGHVCFLEHDIQTAWPVGDESIDVVIGNLVLEHVERVGHVFAKAARVLRRGGVVFICELHPIRQFLGARAHFVDGERRVVEVPVVRHTVSEFVNAGLDAGLTLDRLDEWSDDGAPDSPPRLLSLSFSKR
jgi:ubiquinone/menaquinone biosynthesis C-methylase UbiE